MDSFAELVLARKEWINTILKPWCQRAIRVDLLKAETEWLDIAGKVPPEKTLWVWAWSRFPQLVHDNLGIEETSEIEAILTDGRTIRGFPDSRKSQHGQLMIWGCDPVSGLPSDLGPYSIDQIAAVRRLPDSTSLNEP